MCLTLLLLEVITWHDGRLNEEGKLDSVGLLQCTVKQCYVDFSGVNLRPLTSEPDTEPMVSAFFPKTQVSLRKQQNPRAEVSLIKQIT